MTRSSSALQAPARVTSPSPSAAPSSSPRATAAEDLLELIMRRCEKAATLITSNRPVEDWGKLLGDNAAVAAMLDRLLHHAHVFQFGPRCWHTKDTKWAMEVRTSESAG
nr:ATP-binding protein [Myxococcus xanthus]